MNKKREPKKVKSLPPNIDGEVKGYLTMKVDEIVWHREPCVNTVVLVQWWGENEPSVFRPMNVISNLHGTAANTTVLYEIKTSISLLEEYLKDCEVLDLCVTDEQLSTVMGLVTIRDLYSIIQENPCHSYFPILNTFGTRIGDLHVGFTVQFLDHSKKSHNFMHLIKEEMSNHRAVTCQVNTLGGHRHRLRQGHEHYKSLLKYQTLPSDLLSSPYDIYTSQQSRGSQLVSDAVILGILERGQRFRDAMVRSVLEDGAELVANDFDISTSHSDSSTDKILSRQLENTKMCFDCAEVKELLSGREMTHKTEECAKEGLKNMAPTGSSWEMAGKLGQRKGFHAEVHKAIGRKCSNISESELETYLQTSGPSEEISGSTSTETTHRDYSMKNVDSLQITVQSLALNNIGRYMCQNSVQSGFQLTPSEIQQKNLLHKLSEECGTVYFVECELPFVEKVTPHLSKHVKGSEPYHTSVKRFCSRKKTGSDIYFGQSTWHNLPSTQASLQKFLRDRNITFRIFCRQLHQRVPTQIGAAHLGMINILRSKSFSFCRDVEVICGTKMPECQVVIGLLKISVKLKTRWKSLGNDLQDKLHKDFVGSTAGNNCGSRKHNSEASISHMSDPAPSSRCDDLNTSGRICKNSRRKITRRIVTKEQEFCKNGQQKIQLNGEVMCPSLRDICVNKPALLHGLLHISRGQGYDGVNSYLVCRTFWRDDVITGDIYCKTGSPCYNFHELIPVLLSAELLERSHNNFFTVEVWQRISARCDTLIGVAKLSLNNFFIAYRDPVVSAQLLLSKYPVIGVDGWVRVHNPVTDLTSGHLFVVLALGTEDQVKLLEVTRGLKEAVFTHTLQDFREPMHATCADSCSDHTTCVEEPVSLEPQSLVNHHEPVFLGQSEFQARHVRNSLSEVPQRLYHNMPAMESLPSYCCNVSDNVPTLDAQEDIRSLSVDVSNLTGSLPSVRAVLHGTKHQEGKIYGTEFQGNSYVNVARQLEVSNNQAIKSNAENLHSFQNAGSAVSSKCPTIRRKDNTQEPNFQFPTHILSHSNVDSFGTKKLYQHVVEQQVRPPQHGKSSLVGAGKQTYGIFNSKSDSCLLSAKQADIGISAKDQESQTDLYALALTSSVPVTSQNTSRITRGSKFELPRSPPGDIFYETFVSGNEVSFVQSEDVSDLRNSSSVQNEHVKESVRNKELSQDFAELNCSFEDCTGPGISEPCSESEQFDSNADTNTGLLSSLLHDSLTPQPAEVDHKSSFHTYIEIERAMHLQCFSEHNSNIADAGTSFEPSTYVTFVVMQTTDESELKMATPLALHTADPVWHLQCDVWLPSDLLTNNSKCMIFNVWWSVNGLCRDPVKDIVLGCTAVDLSALLFGLPSISGWFNIMDFVGHCIGQIKINITPLEDLNCINPYRTSEPEMLKLQENCNSKYLCRIMDCQQTESENCNMKGSVAVTSSCDVNYSSDDLCHAHSDTSTDIIPRKVTDTHEVLLHHISNKSNGVTECSVKCDAGIQDISYLSKALNQKLSELDEITQRLKKNLHIVTNKGFTLPFLPLVHETENSFRPAAASHIVSNAKDDNSTKCAAVTSVNEPPSEGKSVLKITNSSDITVSYTKFSINTKPGLSSTSINSLPQSNVTSNEIWFEKGSENDIGTETSVNHTSPLTGSCHYDPGGRSKISSRVCAYELGEIWNEGVSKTGSNGTRLQHVDMMVQCGRTDDPYRPTDYLMEMCARNLEVDSVFNPLLFHQLLSSCDRLNISGLGSEHAECCYKSEGKTGAKASTETVENSSYFGSAAAQVNAAKAGCLMYSPKQCTYVRNDRLYVNSKSGNCDVNGAEIEETSNVSL